MQPLRRTAVDADPTAEPVRQRPVLRPCFKALQRIPTIGEVTAQKLMKKFGDGFLASMLGDNIHEFINLMDDQRRAGLSDRQAHRMERAMANMEFGFGEGGYQPSEFVKALPAAGHVRSAHRRRGARVQERRQCTRPGHGRAGSEGAQDLLLTGTLMGGYGDDLFHLLFRALPGRMIEDGYRPTKSGSMTSAAMAFMRDHGVLKDIYSESTGAAHKTAEGHQGHRVERSRLRVRSQRACCVASCRSRCS